MLWLSLEKKIQFRNVFHYLQKYASVLKILSENLVL